MENRGNVMSEQRQRPDDHEEQEERWAKRWPWLLPLAAGIFLGGAVFEMQPEALELAGSPAWLWAIPTRGSSMT